jgi:universal stress protein A
MFAQILVPVDLSDKNSKALDVAAELAQQSRGSVVLLHVIEIMAGLPVEEEKVFYNRLERMARQHLSRLGNRLKSKDVTCREEVIYGNRAFEIVKYARDQGSELIVLTSPAINPNNPAEGWGSLSFKISVVSPCPVLLVK